jgi:hypothetical protein
LTTTAAPAYYFRVQTELQAFLNSDDPFSGSNRRHHIHNRKSNYSLLARDGFFRGRRSVSRFADRPGTVCSSYQVGESEDETV